MYRLIGRAHAALLDTAVGLRRARRADLHEARGQGTVEYVALILLVALVMAGVVAAMKGFRTDEGKELGDVLIGKIKEAVRRVQF
jgi:hypothetical protein